MPQILPRGHISGGDENDPTQIFRPRPLALDENPPIWNTREQPPIFVLGSLLRRADFRGLIVRLIAVFENDTRCEKSAHPHGLRHGIWLKLDDFGCHDGVLADRSVFRLLGKDLTIHQSSVVIDPATDHRRSRKFPRGGLSFRAKRCENRQPQQSGSQCTQFASPGENGVRHYVFCFMGLASPNNNRSIRAQPTKRKMIRPRPIVTTAPIAAI